MYKILAIFTIAVLLSVGLSVANVSPCYSDNETSTNVTLLSPDMAEIATALEDINNQVTDSNDLLTEVLPWIGYFFELFLLLGLLVITLIMKDNIFLCVLTAVVSLFTGTTWLQIEGHIFEIIGFSFMVTACYMVYEAVMNAFFRKSKPKKG